MKKAPDLKPANGCERLLSRSEVATLMRVTPRSVTKWTQQGILTAVRLPNRKQVLGYLPSAVHRLLSKKA